MAFRHKLGEVENEHTPEKLVFFAICRPKISTIGRNLTKFWQKNKFDSFFWDTVCCIAAEDDEE